jgi:hypothetical protein
MVKAGLEAVLAEVWRKGGIWVRFLIWPDKHLKIPTTVYRNWQSVAETMVCKRMIDADFSEN